LLSFKNINAIAHYTDWIPAHVHVGALGWNGFLSFAVMYYMIPKMYGREMFSKKLLNAHFWLGTLGVLFWAVPMYISGFTQGMMWKEFTAEGNLKYASFLETTLQLIPLYMLRALGGLFYLSGALIGAYNIFKTMLIGKLIANEPAQAPAMEKIFVPQGTDTYWHRWVERKPLQMLFWSFVVVGIGGVIEIIPTFMIKSNIPTITAVQPYTPLELEGRDLYIREGCVSCHSQMIRPFRSETERYGEYSKAGEFVYDHPFLWGSKRTGPDLHREGGKYPDSWHYQHMRDPTSMSPGSIMPPYEFLIEQKLNTGSTKTKLKAMKTLGVPYDDYAINHAERDLAEQAKGIAENLAKENIKVKSDREIIALIAYLQRLGTDIKKGE
jgi:cytochrome c oxidase cbb3-type subunit I/II